jgi:hypothetical protein
MVSHGPAASVELADTIGHTNRRDARPSTAGVAKKPGTPVGETAATTLIRKSRARSVVVSGLPYSSHQCVSAAARAPVESPSDRDAVLACADAAIDDELSHQSDRSIQHEASVVIHLHSRQRGKL